MAGTKILTLKITRIGECKQCGFCCGFIEGKITEGSCSHLTSDGKCSIWDKRHEYCPEHGTTHENCIKGPLLPLRKLNPKCGYRFIMIDSGAEVINIELADWEFLSKHG
jgi:Fe-S-cluster containining protein